MLAYADAVVAHFGTVNQVYNNAGIAYNGNVEKSEFKDMERIIDVDFWGVVNGTKAFLPHLIASGDGHMVNISSLFGLIAIPGQSAYNAAKFAVRGFTEALRQEMLIGKHPVKVTCVHPGGIKTAVARNATVADGEDAANLRGVLRQVTGDSFAGNGRRDHCSTGLPRATPGLWSAGRRRASTGWLESLAPRISASSPHWSRASSYGHVNGVNPLLRTEYFVSKPRRIINPRRWKPPASPVDGGRTSKTAPLTIDRQLAVGGHGPEDVMLNDNGHLVTGLSDGSIVTIDPVSGERTVLGNTGGRPLGVEPCRDGSVLVCDHDRGLLRMSGGGSIEVLVETIGQEKLRFASNVVEGEDGTIWFTSSTSRWDLDHYKGDLLEHSCTGRLVQRDPDGTVTTLAADLAFADGLVLAPDGSHLLYAESGRYQISRFWLTGPKRGSSDPFHTNLPGFPDNMSLGSAASLGRHRRAAQCAARCTAAAPGTAPCPGLEFPERFQPTPSPLAWVMAFDLDGQVIHDLRTSDGSYGFTTSVVERDGTLVLGSLNEEHLAVAGKPAPLEPER